MGDPQVQANDELEIAEARNSLSDLLYDVAANVSTTGIGGFVYRRFDSALSTVEKTAKWSLPQPPPLTEDDDKMNISPPPLIRPLPWVLFLPALVVLRMFRIGLSLLALVFGKPPVLPETVVSFMQNKRRKLRALKYRGQKLHRISRAEKQVEEELHTTWLSRIILPLRTVICRRRLVSQCQNQTQQQEPQQPAKKRNVNERDQGDSSDDDATCNELLDKYEDDAGDSSYHVDEASEDSSDTSISELEKSDIAPLKPLDLLKKINGHANKEQSDSSDPNQFTLKSSLNILSNLAENGSVEAVKKEKDAKTSGNSDDQAKSGSLGSKNLSASEPESTDSKPTNQTEDNSSKAQSGQKPAENGSVEASKKDKDSKQSSTIEQIKTSNKADDQTNSGSKNPTTAEHERTDNKPTNLNASSKDQTGENSSRAQPATCMSDVKANYHQKNKHHQPHHQQQHHQPQNQQQQHHSQHQQQQHPHQQPQQHQQHSQTQYNSANGGGGGRKQKRTSNAQN